MNKADVLKLLAATKMLWPSWRDAPTTEREWSLMSDVWLTIIGDLDADLCYAALSVLNAEGREFIPSPGTVRRQAILLRARASGDLPPGVDEAWREVRTVIESGPDVRSNKVWSHPCVEAAVDSIGWYELRTSPNQDSLRAHFRQFYTEAKERYERDLVLSDSMMEAISTASLRALTE